MEPHPFTPGPKLPPVPALTEIIVYVTKLKFNTIVNRIQLGAGIIEYHIPFQQFIQNETNFCKAV